MVDLNVYVAKDDRVCGFLTALPLVKNGVATFFIPEYGIELERAYCHALSLSRALNTQLTISGDISLFRKMYPDVIGTLTLPS